MQRKLIYLYLFCLLTILPLVQAAKPASGTQLEQYQKVVEDTRGYRSFGYEEGVPINFEKSGSFCKDNFGYMWLRIDGNKKRMYRFNGTSFQDMFRDYPKAERDSLQELKVAADGSLYVTSSHYLYKWEGYRFTKYAFPKDDRMTDSDIQKSVVYYGVKGYAVLRDSIWRYYRIPIAQDHIDDVVEPLKLGNKVYTFGTGKVVSPYAAKHIDDYNRMLAVPNEYTSGLFLKYNNQGEWDSLLVVNPSELLHLYPDMSKVNVKIVSISDGNSWLYLMKTNRYYKVVLSNKSVTAYQYPSPYIIDQLSSAYEQRYVALCSPDSICYTSIGNPPIPEWISFAKPRALIDGQITARIFFRDTDMTFGYKDTGLLQDFISIGKSDLFRVNRVTNQMIPITLPNYQGISISDQGLSLQYLTKFGNAVSYTYKDLKTQGVHHIYVYDLNTGTLQHRVFAEKQEYIRIHYHDQSTHSIVLQSGQKLWMINMSENNNKLQGSGDQDYEYAEFMQSSEGKYVQITKAKDVLEFYKLDSDSLFFLLNFSNSSQCVFDSENVCLLMTNGKKLYISNLRTGKQSSLLFSNNFKLYDGRIYSFTDDGFGKIWSYNDTGMNIKMIEQFSLEGIEKYFEKYLQEVNIPFAKVLPALDMSVLSNDELFVDGGDYQISGSKDATEINKTLGDLSIDGVNELSKIPLKVETVKGRYTKFRFPAFIYNIKTHVITPKPYWKVMKENDQVFITFAERLKDGTWQYRIGKYIPSGQVKREYTDFVLPINPDAIGKITPMYVNNQWIVISERNGCLYYRDGTQWKSITIPDDYLSRADLMTSSQDRVWLSKHNSSELLLVSLSTKSCFRYTSQDGVPEGIKDINADDRGQLYILAADGLYKMNLANTKLKLNIPWIAVNKVNHDATKALLLSSDQNNISIPVDILNFMYPEKCQLEYRLIGFDDTWQRRNYTAQVEYAKLRSGKYRFEIRAITPEGTRTEVQSYDIRILPPWYNTWWAYLLYVLITAALINAIYRWRTRQLMQRNLALENTVKERTAELEDRQKRIQDAIEYASVIQSSILPQSVDMQAAFADYFAIWKPRDVVGGDFYWLYTDPVSMEILVGVIDCTGHSVPGALLSMTVNSILKSIVIDRQINSPHLILHELHREIGSTLHQEREFTSQDGMELGILRINRQQRQLSFSGAGLNLISFDPAKGAVEVIRGNRHGIGGLKWHKELIFDEVLLSYNPNTRFYIYSDGIIDQPNPAKDKNRRLGNADWIDVIGSIAALELSEQEAYLLEFIDKLLDFHEQRDDITLLCLVPDKA